MSETIKEYLVSIGFNVDEKSLSKFNNGLKSAAKSAAVIGTAAVAAAGIVTKVISDVAKSFDETRQLSQRVNATANEIKQLGYVASVSGSSIEAANRSFEGLNRTAGEAALNIGRGATAFKELGLSAKKQNGDLKTTGELMAEVGDKIKDLSSQEQVAVLTRLGIDPTLVKTLTGDIKGLKSEFNSLYKSVGINAEKAGEQSEAFNDSVTKLSFVFDTLKKSIALKFMPQIKVGIDSLRKFMVENAPKIIQAIISGAFLKITGRIAQVAGVIISWFTKINDATDGWAGTILAAVAAWKMLNLAFLASPIGIILSLVAAIALLVDDFLTFKEGGQSLIDWNNDFGKALGVTIEVVKFLGKLIGIFISGTLQGLSNALKMVFDGIFISIKAAIAGVLKITGFINKIGSSIKGFFGFGDGNQNSNPGDLSTSPLTSNSMSSNQNVNQETKIIIQGDSSPEATAKAVAGQQTRVRNVSGVIR
jgi:hypothetical protein